MKYSQLQNQPSPAKRLLSEQKEDKQIKYELAVISQAKHELEQKLEKVEGYFTKQRSLDQQEILRLEKENAWLNIRIQELDEQMGFYQQQHKDDMDIQQSKNQALKAEMDEKLHCLHIDFAQEISNEQDKSLKLQNNNDWLQANQQNLESKMSLLDKLNNELRAKWDEDIVNFSHDLEMLNKQLLIEKMRNEDLVHMLQKSQLFTPELQEIQNQAQKILLQESNIPSFREQSQRLLDQKVQQLEIENEKLRAQLYEINNNMAQYNQAVSSNIEQDYQKRDNQLHEIIEQQQNQIADLKREIELGNNMRNSRQFDNEQKLQQEIKILKDTAQIKDRHVKELIEELENLKSKQLNQKISSLSQGEFSENDQQGEEQSKQKLVARIQELENENQVLKRINFEEQQLFTQQIQNLQSKQNEYREQDNNQARYGEFLTQQNQKSTDQAQLIDQVEIQQQDQINQPPSPSFDNAESLQAQNQSQIQQEFTNQNYQQQNQPNENVSQQEQSTAQPIQQQETVLVEVKPFDFN